ncbi:MAG: hypothetical protein JW908_09120 [Anaerolineales bacterium]|nr:hypothetical protein [Anaerolineales bacterium]
MADQKILDVFDLPSEVPACIVKIQDFDDNKTLQDNIRDYVITDSVAAEMERLVDRIVTSCVRQEAGAGHYLHGSFGSGKSHFMAILGLILENNPSIWTKEHVMIQDVQDRHGQWLADHPILVVPVYMLGQESLQRACYNAANQRLEKLRQPVCEFSDADKVIASFNTEAERYGEVVYQQFEAATGISAKRFARLVGSGQDERDELAQKILSYRNPSRTERAQLYPDKFSDGMAMLTQHALQQGFAGAVFLVDELILYLTGKGGREYVEEFNDLVALADNSALDRAVPLWVLVAKQRNIAETVPDDSSQQHIFDVMEHHKDRFPETTELADTELIPIVEERVLKIKAGKESVLESAVEGTINDLEPGVRQTLLHDLSLQDFRRVYPFHPALIRSLIDVSARLSRERAAIRLLYELLIKRYPDLPVGSLVPYSALFDVVFLRDGLAGGSRNEELEAVRQTYYERLEPLIQDAYGDTEQSTRARQIVKTVLLLGLSRGMRADIDVERILHLNYQNLKGRTAFGSYQIIAGILSDLDNRSELVHFTPNPTSPALGIAHITLATGVQLVDVLKRVQVNWRQRLETFQGLMKEMLNKPIQNGEIPNYERLWRGSRRKGRVRFVNVAELSTNDMVIQNGDEFTLFVDYPFSADVGHGRSEDRGVVDRAKAQLPPIPVGFWLPEEFTPEDLRDLEELARMGELESNPGQYLDQDYGRAQRDELLTKLVGQKRSKSRSLRERLLHVYKGSGAQVSFLDKAITPTLDVETLDAALDRISDTVCDRRYPHHPRFGTEANQRALRRLLEDFLVPAAIGSGTVARTADLDGWLTRLGIPLELAEQGAHNWTLLPQSRYLKKLEELASGRQVETNKIRRGLEDAFGFNRDLSDTLILYLVRGHGYRALRGTQPVTQLDYGILDGLVLERGERLAAHEWAQVKEMIQNTWGVPPQATDLTVGAQDQLWRQLNASARNARNDLEKVQKHLGETLKLAEIKQEQATRWIVLEAAIALNQYAMREDIDPHDGLKQLLVWKPASQAISCEDATGQISLRTATMSALDRLQTDTVEHIITLAQAGDSNAEETLKSLRDFLAATDKEKDLASHVLTWQQQAKSVIDAALKVKVPGGSDTDKGSEIPGKAVRDRELHFKLSAQIEFGGITRPIQGQDAENALRTLVNHVELPETTEKTELVIRVQVSKEE